MSKGKKSGANAVNSSSASSPGRIESSAQLSSYAKLIRDSKRYKDLRFKKEYRDTNGRHLVEVTVPSRQGRIRVVWSFDLQGELRMKKARERVVQKRLAEQQLGERIQRYPRHADGHVRFPRLGKPPVRFPRLGRGVVPVAKTKKQK